MEWPKLTNAVGIIHELHLYCRKSFKKVYIFSKCIEATYLKLLEVETLSNLSRILSMKLDS